MIPESSLAEGWYCISRAIFAISSKTLFPLNFKFFCFFFHFWVVLEWFDVQRGAESTTSTWACLFWMVSFTVLQVFTSCLGHVITHLLWRQIQENDCGSQGTCDTDFPTGTPQVYDFNLVIVKFGWPGRGSWCRVNQMGTTEEACTLAFSNQEAPPGQSNF